MGIIRVCGRGWRSSGSGSTMRGSSRRVRGKGETPEEEGIPTPNPCTTAEPRTGKGGRGAEAEREPEEEAKEAGKKDEEVVKEGARNPRGGGTEAEEETGTAWGGRVEEGGGTQGPEEAKR